jgi:hypothetical protein
VDCDKRKRLAVLDDLEDPLAAIGGRESIAF